MALHFHNKYNKPMDDRQAAAGRYQSPILSALLTRIGDQSRTQQLQSVRKVEEERKMSYSFSACIEKSRELEQRPLFNNKTSKQGRLLDTDIHPVPYRFIPKYKNDTFIMPNRVFQKGPAGRRFHVKMKDSSIYSFREAESIQESRQLRREEKEKTVLSRKVEQYIRMQIVDKDDGKVRASHCKELLKSTKKFKYNDTRSELFSQSHPMLEPKEHETKMVRKTSLAKAYDFTGKWRINSRGLNFFQKKTSKSASTHYPNATSTHYPNAASTHYPQTSSVL